MGTEKEFLSQYSIENYERPSVTTDVAAFTIGSKEENSYRHNPENTLLILLIKRGEHPFKDQWALPGGFLRPSETVEECALREIVEETGVNPSTIKPVGVFSKPGRDPRGWIISNAFASIICDADIKTANGYDASDAKWFAVSLKKNVSGMYYLNLECDGIEVNAVLKKKSNKLCRPCLEIVESNGLAFDHAEIITVALEILKKSADSFDVIFNFLPEKFTLNSLQKVLETITEVPVVPANFRRKIEGMVIETDEYKSGAGHRPAKLFRKK